MYIEISKESEDRLSSKLYKFWITTEYRPIFQMIVDTYAERIRRTTRCKWVTDSIYARLDRRNSDILSQDVTIPEGIVKEMKEKLKKMIDDTPLKMELG